MDILRILRRQRVSGSIAERWAGAEARWVDGARCRGLKPAATPKDNYGDSDSSSQNDERGRRQNDVRGRRLDDARERGLDGARGRRQNDAFERDGLGSVRRRMLRSLILPATAFCVCWWVGGAVAQSPTATRAESEPMTAERIDLMRGQIQVAEAQHASREKTGTLWLQLANSYYDQLEFSRAEDAFGHAAGLLRGSTARAAYAEALAGMGSIYVSTHRLDEAEDYLKNARKIFAAVGDRGRQAELHDTTAEVDLAKGRYREAAAESAEGLAELQALDQPDPVEMMVAYLVHSDALCRLGRCAEAIADTDRAIATMQQGHSTDPLELTAAYMMRGVEEWKLGTVSAGEHDIQEALKIVRGPTNLPRAAAVCAELGEMRQYEALLKESHRKAEAQQIEIEIGRLEAGQPVECAACTVSAAALGFRH
jgi:tetratricopeptide (TPR) repeat protein